tara:strand:+ start:44081 stop:44407 length:327 start_codon:yes stop_codon:yes gene_type:complete
MLWKVWKVWKVVLSFHNIPYIKTTKVLIYRGMEVWKIFSRFRFQNLKKRKMYTNLEIKTIIKNCRNTEELLRACRIFSVLILFGDMKKSTFLNTLAHNRFRELEILGK